MTCPYIFTNQAQTICETTFTVDDDDVRVKCTKDQCGKLTCYACIKKMIEVMFGEPHFNYPFKCGQCSALLDQTIFLRCIVEQNQFEKFIACIFPLYWAKDCLEANEVLVECPFCPYFEIHTTDTCSPQFFHCQHPLCQKKSCLICLHTIENDESESKHRLYCSELRSYKQLIEKAIASGSQQHCPHCQLTGLKDDGCTHMPCERCGHTWCYLCGMKENQCSVAHDAEPSFSAHNADWQVNQGRCPMSLTSIHEVDTRWPDDDRGCLEYFHRYRTLTNLFEVLQLIGEDKFNEINQYFGIINTSGYTMQEIKNSANQVFIDYSSQTNT